MKVICAGCQARYSIADDKIAGRSVKIRCKRCHETIAIRAEPDEKIWYLAVDGGQQGPFSRQCIGRMLSVGQVESESHVWAEGFENWVPMRNVSKLASLLTAASETAQVGAARQQPQMGPDPFAKGEGSGREAVESGLFGKRAASDHREGRSPSKSGGAESMTGVRSENSLLFSLDNLQALATGSSLAMGGSTGEAKSGFATGEGSGLIDIRALASASGVGDDGDGRQEELPGLGSQPGAFEALGSPMLMATTEGRDRRKNYLLPVGLAGGCLLMASAMVATAILMKPDPATEAIGIAGPIAVADAPRHANVAGSTRSGPIRVVQLAGQDRAVQPATDADKPPKRDAKVDVRRRRPERSQKASEVVTRTPRTTEPKRPPLASNRGTSELGIAELMDGALEPRRRPSRRQVLAAMNRVKRSVQDCAKGQGGIAHAQLTVKGATGRVSHVRVTGKSGPVGSCIARAVRAARFPKFANAELEVTFPFRLSDGKS